MSQSVVDRIANVVDAWSNLRPTRAFAGMTLDEFKAVVQPSLDARDDMTVAKNSFTAAMVRRDNADAAARRVILRVIAAIVADEQEGDNGELYAAMGYVRRDERASGLHRAPKDEEKEVSLPQAA